ncbi:MAG: 3,4-dihydroxy-2-butanone-4-phosphate synthase [Pyrobaculum sp.]
MLYDGHEREAEVDFVVRADVVTPEVTHWLRKHAGGLLCFVTTRQIGEALGLEFQSELYKRLGFVTKTPYGDEPAFMTYVNHVKTKTGVRDVDKTLTIRELSRVVSIALEDSEKAREEFRNNFYMPGHVPILGGRVGSRWGHTELSLVLAQAAGIPPALAIIETLGENLEAMSLEEAAAMSRQLGVPLVTKDDVKALFLSLPTLPPLQT